MANNPDCLGAASDAAAIQLMNECDGDPKNKKNIQGDQYDLDIALADCVQKIGAALGIINAEHESLKRRLDALEKGCVSGIEISANSGIRMVPSELTDKAGKLVYEDKA